MMDKLEQNAAKMKRMDRRHDLVLAVLALSFIALGVACIVEAMA